MKYHNYKLGKPEIISIVRMAIKEDVGNGDITSRLLIPKNKVSQAVLSAQESFVVCGLEVARCVFKEIDRNIKFKGLLRDGQKVKKGMLLARIQGKTQSILTAERVALNFLSLLSGVATKTRAYVEAAKPNPVKILDTRKTIPLLRRMQKYAVMVGGGFNHRMGLDEMILVKDNHWIAFSHQPSAFSLKSIIARIRKKIHKKIKIEIEVENLKEFKVALQAGADIIMLDNMNIADIKKAVKIRNTLWTMDYGLRTKLEASGGVSLRTVKKIAACGVDLISIGELTHSLESTDISLEVL